MFSRFFLNKIQLPYINFHHFSTMSQHFGVFQQNLFKTLEADILKYKQYGPPVFQLNIPCKHKEHCRYGRYSCNYSHNNFCKFQKNGKKCLNAHCTYNHELPLEYQLAQAFLFMEMQFPNDISSSEAPISTSEYDFLSNSSSKSGTSVQSVFRFKVNDSPTKSNEINAKINSAISSQPQKRAETHFSAFSPTFQIPVNSKTTSTDQKRLITQSKPTQNPLKMEKTSPTNNKITSNNAQQTQKTSKNYQKAADQKSTVPERISSPKCSPPQ